MSSISGSESSESESELEESVTSSTRGCDIIIVVVLERTCRGAE
jgi:hypothetical protein